MKLKFKKIIFFLFTMFLLLSALNIFAEEEKEKKEKELKFPGKLNLEYKSQLDSDIKGAQPEESIDSQQGGDLLFRNELKASVTFIPIDFYNQAVWLKDRLDLRFYDINTSDSQIKVRNRFYAGLDNMFMIPKIMTIAPNFELRLNNDINSKGNGTEVRLSSIFYMAGKYDFGFSFKLNTLFEFYLYPALYQFPGTNHREKDREHYGSGYWGDDDNKLFQKIQIELDSLNLAFEFFHFFAPKQIKCALTYDMYMLATIYVPAYRDQYNDWYGDNYKNDENPTEQEKAKYVMNKMDYMKHYLGFNFDFWGIQPFAGFYCIITQNQGSWRSSDDEDEFNLNGLYTEFRPGLKCGLIVKKDWFELGVIYSGVILVASTDPLMEHDKADEIYPASYNWENHISCYVKFKY